MGDIKHPRKTANRDVQIVIIQKRLSLIVFFYLLNYDKFDRIVQKGQYNENIRIYTNS